MIWWFWIYSFLGYLLEKGFAWATQSEQQGRKGFLALPLCPVYGLGMLAVLALPLILIPTHTRLRLPKWLGYAIYPLHLVLLIVLRVLLKGATWEALTAYFR